jgi:hypothetical protein
MDMDDFAEPEVGAAVAVTAAICSPRLRKTLRKGLVYSLAGLIWAGDAARGAVSGAGKVVKAKSPK